MSRHNIPDELWQRLEPLVCLPRKDPRGRPSKDARLMFNGILWILRTGAPWSDLPAEFGPWQTVYKRFNAWVKLPLWQDILATLAQDADLEAALFDGSYIRAHQHAAGGKGSAKPRPSAAAVAA